MKLYIKNMVCDRCKMAVEQELNRLGLQPLRVDLGEVDLGKQAPEQETLNTLGERLQALGFELIDDKKSQLIERIKTIIIEQIHYSREPSKLKLSIFLAEELGYDYNYLSNLFSSIEGITIEQYYIQQKIEKVKELLVYDELSLSEIAWQLGYSSAAYLSNQFKKVTGLSPSHFRQLKDAKQRKSLDKL